MLGYGAMELRGAPRARDITEAQAETILNAVLDAGINYIDTSIDYGLSEERIGHDLESLAPGVRPLPPCDVGVLAAVIERLAAVVGTDSGPRHIAAALEVPTFAWFGPTHPDTWNPAGARHGFIRTELPCRACDRTHCPHWNCMPALTPEHVSTPVLEHLARHGRTADLGTAARA